MILPTYRPMHHDELLYGWIRDLAEINFSGDIYGVQRTAKRMFPYGYAPDRRYVIRKGERVRLDYMCGLDESLRRLRDDGYQMPETDHLILYNTILGATGICRKPSVQARYLYTALTTVYGDLLDMPAPASTIKAIRICPVCMQENAYIRTWHQFPGVMACAEHGVRLESDEGTCVKNAEQADESEIRYARYVKEIYDNPRMVSLDDVRRTLIGTASVKEINRINQTSAAFEYVLRMLIKYGIRYEDIKGSALPLHDDATSDGVRLYHIVSKHENSEIVELKCPSCGKVFSSVPYAVQTGFGCPDCMRMEHPKTIIDRAMKQTGDGWYHIVGPFRGMSAVYDVKHMTCGQSTKMRIISRVWDHQKCGCERPHSVNSVQQIIDSVSQGFRVIEYQPSVESTMIRHIACGKIKKYNLQQFVRSPVCPYCREKEYTDSAASRILSVLGMDYSYVGAVSTGIERVYTVRHTVCGTEISGTVRQFIGTKYIRPKRCTLCFKYEEGTRTLQKSDAGKAIEDMTAWFKEHRIWTLKQHRKIGHNTLKKLCGAGLIYHVGFGMYSSVRDIDIYELLEERYLKNDEGNTIGRFTGKTSAFLAGMIDEPEIITLETSSVRRLDNHLYTICGRSVSVKGIKSGHAKGDD